MSLTNGYDPIIFLDPGGPVTEESAEEEQQEIDRDPSNDSLYKLILSQQEFVTGYESAATYGGLYAWHIQYLTNSTRYQSPKYSVKNGIMSIKFQTIKTKAYTPQQYLYFNPDLANYYIKAWKTIELRFNLETMLANKFSDLQVGLQLGIDFTKTKEYFDRSIFPRLNNKDYKQIEKYLSAWNIGFSPEFSFNISETTLKNISLVAEAWRPNVVGKAFSELPLTGVYIFAGVISFPFITRGLRELIGLKTSRQKTKIKLEKVKN